ncbi:NACHT, LRR and PYD domains-containing protein 12-like [Astyanax mexicanus]|uniref:NACHT, LRR and PYD domains-containing protein 12-like n=1 Tax=Astyanax mexicanus TaxID=7994 RepID=UPI0020CB5507|nr:NACHT, LRR and PYD domains-containing protein 12-like [Astyanax mexicanus]
MLMHLKHLKDLCSHMNTDQTSPVQTTTTQNPTASSELVQNTTTQNPTASSELIQTTTTQNPTASSELIQTTTTQNPTAPSELVQNTTTQNPTAPSELVQTTTTQNPTASSELIQTTTTQNPTASSELIQNTTTQNPTAPSELVQTTTTQNPTAPSELVLTTTTQNPTAPSELVLTTTAQTGGNVIAPVLQGNFYGSVHIHAGAESQHEGGAGGGQVMSESSAASSTILTADEQHCIKLKDTLKLNYERLIGSSQTGHQEFLEDIYTDLVIVQNKSGGVINEHEVMQIEMSPNKAGSEEECIKCSDIFKVQPGTGRRNRKVMTMGIAGVGKTVSVNKFILDWADRKENQDIQYIFPLPFRELNLKKEKEFSLIELLNNCFFSSKPALKSLPEEDGKVLFIFDGLDEYRYPLEFKDGEEVKDVNEKSTVGSLIINLINRNLLCFALVWVTCRPAAAHQIPHQYINLVTEVRGFNDEQKEEYFIKYCKTEDVAEKIISHIKKLRSLHIMCQIPVFCWISATVLQPLMDKESYENIPKTLTEMYMSFLLQQKNLMKEKYSQKTDTDPERIILKLGELAFCNLESGELNFYEDNLKKCGIDVSDGTVFSGVCTQIFSQRKGISKRNIFSFVHLSVQESLAAVYVHESYCNKKKNVLKKTTFWNKLGCKHKSTQYTVTDLHKSAVDRALQSENGHLDLFLRFLLGLSVKESQAVLTELLPNLKIKAESISKTANYVKEKLKEEMHSDRSLNLLHCLSELKDNSLTAEIQNFLNSGTLSKQELSSTQWSALIFVLMMSEEIQEKFELKKYRASEEGLRRLLPVVKITQRALLASCDLGVKSCASLKSVLKLENSSLKELDLSNNDLQDSGVELLSAGLKSSHCKLQILRLASCNLGEKTCESLGSVLKLENFSIKELDLSNNDLQDSGVELLSAGLRSSHCKLQILRLASCNLGEKTCESLGSVLKLENFSIKELDLSNNDLQDSGVELLSAGLRSSHCKLQILRLASCNLGEKTCESLGSVLKLENFSIKELDLSNNDLQDSGVELLSAGLRSSHCELQILRLSGCMITEKGCSSLASALSSNPSHLKELDLTYNHPGESGEKLLSDKLEDPHCSLETLRMEHGGEIRIKPGLKKYGCDFTLDLNTVNPHLSLSEENRRVEFREELQPYPDHPERFDKWEQVLSRERVTGDTGDTGVTGDTGRCYWEAEWRDGGGGAAVALSYKTISRKGLGSVCVFGGNINSWSLIYSDNRYSVLHNNNRTVLSTPPSGCRRVGVYVDCPSGTLSFYSVSSDTHSHTLTHLHTFYTTFTQPLYAGIWIGYDSSVTLCKIE